MSQNEMTVVERQTEEMGIIAPEAMEAAKAYADTLLRSGFIPDHYKKLGDKGPDAIIIALQYGSQIGYRGVTALQNISVINGMPSLKGDASLALIQGSGLLEKWEESYEGKPYENDYRHVIVAKRKGMGEVTYEFSVEDAKRARLWITPEDVQKEYKKQYKPWYTYPKRMLRYRNLGFIVRDMFADLMQGFITDAEAEDMPVEAQKPITVQDADGNEVEVSTKRPTDSSDRLSKDIEKKEAKKEAKKEEIEEAVEVEESDPAFKQKPLTPSESFEGEKKEAPEEKKEEEVAPEKTEEKKEGTGSGLTDKGDVKANFDPEMNEGELTWDPSWEVHKEVALTAMGPVKALMPILEERGLMDIFNNTEGKGSNKKARTIIIKHQKMTAPLREKQEQEPSPTEEAPTEAPEAPLSVVPDENGGDSGIDQRVAEAQEPGESGIRAFAGVKIIWDLLNELGVNEPRANELIKECGFTYEGKEDLCTKGTLVEITLVLSKIDA
jgi:hypothetical protein